MPMPHSNTSSADSQSVYPADTTLFDLCTAELFIVTVLRLWAPRHGCGVEAPDWASAFRVAGITREGTAAFGSLMWIIAGAARRALGIRPRHCRGLGHDEGLLLRLISLLQRDRASEAATVLAEWLPPAGARLAAREAGKLANALAGAGLVVPLRHAEAAALHRLAACAHATPGLALLQ